MIGYPILGKVRVALQSTCDRDLKACDIKLTGLEAIAADKQSRFAEEWEEEGEKKRTQTADGRRQRAASPTESGADFIVCRNCN